MTGHAKLSPSSAARWINCPGSVQLIERYQIPEKEDDYTKEGQEAHRRFEAALLGSYILNPVDNMDAELIPAVEWVLTNIPQGFVTETKVPIWKAFGLPAAWIYGTPDVSYYGNPLSVVDLKYGTSTVPGLENDQALLYAIGIAWEMDWEGFDTVQTVILQPRHGGIKRHVMSREQLQDLMDYYTTAIEQTTLPDAPLNTGKCFFCPVRKSKCPKTRLDITKEFKVL